MIGKGETVIGGGAGDVAPITRGQQRTYHVGHGLGGMCFVQERTPGQSPVTVLTGLDEATASEVCVALRAAFAAGTAYGLGQWGERHG